MSTKLYVGNLSYDTTNADLEQLLAQHGTVQSAEVIQDRDTGRSKGFGFVQMGNDEEAQGAIAGLNGRDHDGRDRPGDRVTCGSGAAPDPATDGNRGEGEAELEERVAARTAERKIGLRLGPVSKMIRS